ncbi:large ribosomal subunit protein eL20-like [Malania oleifera]|uniref:large ribosomal subunit protein eL20-like n=1 Tax=Malania oleifera TaxID=397392 RepID=UPI0025AE8F56|nr:large ribosomal subunit protein eL20-like [Malania oleifera]
MFSEIEPCGYSKIIKSCLEFRIRLFADPSTRFENRYFLRKMKKVKKSKGQILAINKKLLGYLVHVFVIYRMGKCSIYRGYVVEILLYFFKNYQSP